MPDTTPDPGSSPGAGANSGRSDDSRAAGPARRPLPPPLEVDTVRIILVGTALWFVAFLVMLPFVGDLYDAGNQIWLWTSLAGWVLGLIGIGILRLQQHARRPRDTPAL